MNTWQDRLKGTRGIRVATAAIWMVGLAAIVAAGIYVAEDPWLILIGVAVFGVLAVVSDIGTARGGRQRLVPMWPGVTRTLTARVPALLLETVRHAAFIVTATSLSSLGYQAVFGLPTHVTLIQIALAAGVFAITSGAVWKISSPLPHTLSDPEYSIGSDHGDGANHTP